MLARINFEGVRNDGLTVSQFQWGTHWDVSMLESASVLHHGASGHLMPYYWKRMKIMAHLKEEQKLELVSMLACFREPSAIIRYFQLEHGLTIEHKQVGRIN